MARGKISQNAAQFNDIFGLLIGNRPGDQGQLADGSEKAYNFSELLIFSIVI